MIVSQLSDAELGRRLRGSGLAFRTGPFVICLKSWMSQVLRGMSTLYGDFPVVSDPDFVDFHFNVARVSGVRRWLFPRAYFLARGAQAPAFGQFPLGYAMPFLEWGMNAAIFNHVNNYLILHAAVLDHGGRSLLILGDSGAGKSTLCAALTLSGWRLLSDELALIGLRDGLIHPIVRPVSLKNESIGVIQRFSREAWIGPVCHTVRKGAVAHLRPPSDSVRRMDVPSSPHWIVFVRYRAGASLTVEAVPRSRAFVELARGGFNSQTLGELGFHMLCRVLDQSSCRRVSYGDLAEAVAYFNSSAVLSGDEVG